mmetsp:Transcript_2811/g.3989  ORF Transcript_2811/g.3989 Transcript_2811/m.3989 type:complete len:119 (+) Transcript_2811:115-471(+)|eukprot:CAMPEP_0184859594 /NCGR_PEP_ID=MMETSP0580-20130426/4590_1 /TAXON_ID=1118495 /ORGANISM="Dactyliosolen fragilissimus" /LENGTH=118 /DNA_ID=CAMNT_0027356327 /DNA_START=64 /DNA_END=420 /DNA_ORIENTATION=+
MTIADKSENSSKTFKRDPQVAAKIERDANPEPDQHNGGQPLRRQEDNRGQQRSKFFTDCQKQHRNSLGCIEENYENKQLCEPYFEAYRQCKQEERRKRLEENSRISGGDGSVNSCTIS